MGRPIGSKNAEYEARRADLLDAAMPRLLADQGATSFNEIAAEVGVSAPTLRHYFRDRSGLVAAALRHQHRHGAPHLARAAVPSSPDLGTSLTQFLGELAQAWRVFGVGRLFAGGLAMGLRDTAAGPAYLDGILEPTLQAVEARLRACSLYDPSLSLPLAYVEEPNFKAGENFYPDQSDNFFVGNAFPDCGINFTAQEIMGRSESND